MIDSQWRNVCTVVASVTLMLFAMVQIVLALSLNLRADSWPDIFSTTSNSNITKITTGINLLINCFFIFPAAWIGICAAVSRHRGVYIALTVIASLAFLAEIGALVDHAWVLGVPKLFKVPGTNNDEIAVSILVFQSVTVLIILALLIFGILALMYRSRMVERKRFKEEGRPAPYATLTADYTRPTSYQAPSAPARAYSSLGDYRPLTRGSPEWDRFYEQYFTDGKRYATDVYGRRENRRTNSYRF